MGLIFSVTMCGMESFCPKLFPIPDHFPSPESALHPAERPGQSLSLYPSPGPRLEATATVSRNHQGARAARCLHNFPSLRNCRT
ncbi:hypothetical protein BDP81DRAFT_431949 [Colletotrichum phormii]|uniref:Uncharacterized protein n=1 Tax=Colletotrichum phormii TaxID=359342 RepID=A0AAJ0EDJ0_9PEZI|nr:uncharacterized protein BDP81DRAFT_431949 [Colletotrichum phormii]KAK1634763.1 hypothetical protein BDP81DRAFT_431949 [Colletotrichum phormii]